MLVQAITPLKIFVPNSCWNSVCFLISVCVLLAYTFVSQQVRQDFFSDFRARLLEEPELWRKIVTTGRFCLKYNEKQSEKLKNAKIKVHRLFCVWEVIHYKCFSGRFIVLQRF
jgi:hypothetical protein